MRNRLMPPDRDEPDFPPALILITLLGVLAICFAAADSWGRAVL